MLCFGLSTRLDLSSLFRVYLQIGFLSRPVHTGDSVKKGIHKNIRGNWNSETCDATTMVHNQHFSVAIVLYVAKVLLCDIAEIDKPAREKHYALPVSIAPVY